MPTIQPLKHLFGAAALALACALPAQAAVEISGVKLEDSISVNGETLVLNGAGVRQVLFTKVYVAGLYIKEKKSNPADIMALQGTRRVMLTMQRETNSDEFGQLFVTAMNKNTTKEEKAKLVNQTVKFGEVFASTGVLKKGDVVTLDWIPNKGTQSGINGKPNGEPIPGIEFYNAVMRIWLGDNPVQDSLKADLLGQKK